jgi:CheY-like chemotaxis protein
MTKSLVLEDSLLMRRRLRQMLEHQGHTVDDKMPESAIEIQERLGSFAPDLVLSDYQMPWFNGLTVARIVMKYTERKIPVIILTSMRDQDMDASLAKLGVTTVLHETIDEFELSSAIRNVVGFQLTN